MTRYAKTHSVFVYFFTQAIAQYKSRRCSSAWVPLGSLPPQRKLKLAVKEAQDLFETLPRTKNGALRCQYEDVQYSEYAPGGHFKEWHVDADDDGDDEEDGRELTVVCLLTEPNEDFSGGDFEVMADYPHGEPRAVQWTRGDIIAFQAKHLWHRVTPCTSGLRKSLVLWAKHPSYKPAKTANKSSSHGHEPTTSSSGDSTTNAGDPSSS